MSQTDETIIRCQSEQGDGRESEGEGSYERGATRDQEIGKEIGIRIVGSGAIALQGVGGCGSRLSNNPNLEIEWWLS